MGAQKTSTSRQVKLTQISCGLVECGVSEPPTRSTRCCRVRSRCENLVLLPPLPFALTCLSFVMTAELGSKEYARLRKELQEGIQPLCQSLLSSRLSPLIASERARMNDRHRLNATLPWSCVDRQLPPNASLPGEQACQDARVSKLAKGGRGERGSERELTFETSVCCVPERTSTPKLPPSRSYLTDSGRRERMRLRSRRITR